MANFFLGTSPSFKMVHARVSDKKEIVSVELNTYELEIDSDNWLDRGMIQIKKEKIASLSFGDIQLTSKANKWHLSELSETEEVNNQ